MLEDDLTDTISMDSERRVRGVCQLMEGLICEIKASGDSDSDTAGERLQLELSSAIESLDDFLEKGYIFIEKYCDRGIISPVQKEAYARILEEKYDAVLIILKREYAALGAPEVD